MLGAADDDQHWQLDRVIIPFIHSIIPRSLPLFCCQQVWNSSQLWAKTGAIQHDHAVGSMRSIVVWWRSCVTDKISGLSRLFKISCHAQVPIKVCNLCKAVTPHDGPPRECVGAAVIHMRMVWNVILVSINDCNV